MKGPAFVAMIAGVVTIWKLSTDWLARVRTRNAPSPLQSPSSVRLVARGVLIDWEREGWA